MVELTVGKCFLSCRKTVRLLLQLQAKAVKPGPFMWPPGFHVEGQSMLEGGLSVPQGEQEWKGAFPSIHGIHTGPWVSQPSPLSDICFQLSIH